MKTFTLSVLQKVTIYRSYTIVDLWESLAPEYYVDH